MATFFGEVVFPSSRAFWDEDDEEGLAGDIRNKQELFVQWKDSKPTHVRKLIIIEGDTINEFTKECVCKNSEQVATIQDEVQKVVSTIYKISEGLYLSIVSPNYSTKYSGDFIEKISDLISMAKGTIVITCQHVSQYKCTDIPNTPSFLRVLCTKTGRHLCTLQEKSLEQPNIVYGVAAGVLSYAQLLKLPSALYILYTDSFSLDSKSAEPLFKLFSAITNDAVCETAIVSKYFFNKGNLYM